MKDFIQKARALSPGFKISIIAAVLLILFWLREKFNNSRAIYTPDREYKSDAFHSIVIPDQKMRNDSMGFGHYLASRGIRVHEGIDILTYEGEPVYSPFEGTITRQYYAYSNDKKFMGIEILSTDNRYKIKIMYCEHDFSKLPKTINKKVKKGERVATAQAISKKYGFLMNNHLHVELYVESHRVDPADYIKLS